MSTVKCQRCGFVNPAGTTLCQECLGSLLAGPRFVDVDTPTAAPVPTHGQADTDDGWQCPSCSARLGPGDPFCPADGEPRSGAVRTGAVPTTSGAPGLRLTFPGGSSLDVVNGEALDLGRDVDDRRVNTALADRSGVSRRHARVQMRGDSVTVLDLGSTNGTRVNGEPVVDSVVLPLAQFERLDLGMNATVGVSAIR